jgi:hypothetical protein
MREWRFYEPVMALQAIRSLFGVNTGILAVLVRFAFPIGALYCIGRYAYRPTAALFYSAVLSTLCAVLFTQIGHVWPWFVLWALSCAALIPERRLARWVTGVALGAPFVMLVWMAFPDAEPRYTFLWPALCLYAFSLLWLFAGARLPVDGAVDTAKEPAPACGN